MLAGSTSGGSGGGHGGSGGRGTALTKVGQGGDSIYDPTEYGSHGGFGYDHGNNIFLMSANWGAVKFVKFQTQENIAVINVNFKPYGDLFKNANGMTNNADTDQTAPGGVV